MISPAPRVRQVVLDAAKRILVRGGDPISLPAVAELAGVTVGAVTAEFADTRALLDAVLLDEIDLLIVDLAHRDLTESLVGAALALSDNALLEAIAVSAAGLIVRMSCVDVRLAGWQRAAHAVESTLARSGRRGGPMVLRWLSSYLCSPSSEADIRADVDVLIAGLPMLSTTHARDRSATG